MMKKPLFLAVLILAVIVASGCTMPAFGGVKAALGVGEPEYTGTEQLSVSVDPVVDEVRAGNSNELLFDLENKGNTTLKDITVRITDTGPCFTSVEDSGEKTIDELKPGKYESWQWDINSTDDIHTEKNCDIRYRISYRSNSTAKYELAMMSQDEYLRLKKRGELENKSLSYTKTKSPVDIQMSISQDQPILEGEDFYLYLTLKNKGQGIVEDQKLKDHSLVLSYPNDFEKKLLEDASCCQGDMFPFFDESYRLFLLGNHTFMDREISITCKFKLPADSVDISKRGKFRASVSYKYILDKELSVKVIPS